MGSSRPPRQPGRGGSGPADVRVIPRRGHRGAVGRRGARRGGARRTSTVAQTLGQPLDSALDHCWRSARRCARLCRGDHAQAGHRGQLRRPAGDGHDASRDSRDDSEDLHEAEAEDRSKAAARTQDSGPASGPTRPRRDWGRLLGRGACRLGDRPPPPSGQPGRRAEDSSLWATTLDPIRSRQQCHPHAQRKAGRPGPAGHGGDPRHAARSSARIGRRVSRPHHATRQPPHRPACGRIAPRNRTEGIAP